MILGEVARKSAGIAELSNPHEILVDSSVLNAAFPSCTYLAEGAVLFGAVLFPLCCLNDALVQNPSVPVRWYQYYHEILKKILELSRQLTVPMCGCDHVAHKVSRMLDKAPGCVLTCAQSENLEIGYNPPPEGLIIR